MMNSQVLKNLTSDRLIRISVAYEKSKITKEGALCTLTGKYTGRAPNAKKIVEDELTKDSVDWNNNQKISEALFNKKLVKFINYKKKLKKVYLQEVSAVRDKEYALGINIWTEFAKHSVFARNMFVPNDDNNFKAQYTVYHFPSLTVHPQVLISFSQRTILISGTLYSGEIKKSIFTVLNYWFPIDWEFLPMHCSVNVDRSKSNPAIFFGLSGTGKTTLSSDSNRILIGDDEHGWTDKGLVNFEGGCYAKTIRLSSEAEPQIWDACHRKGAILENVVIKNGELDFNDSSYTENSRASYPTSYIDNSDELGYVHEHPNNIIMLTCDSFGVLPPVAKLTADEAVKQFLLGYTAKVAGTEAGVTKPVATFSPCFGLPFMPLPPKAYGRILRRKIQQHNVDCWLVNTGWTGGPHGVGNRMPIKTTRLIIDKILDGTLSKQKIFHHPYTNLYIPVCPDIDSTILIPETGWANLQKYRKEASNLMNLFAEASRNNESR